MIFIYNFIISLLIGYEIHKLFKFKMFFKLRTLTIDYKKEILKKVNSIAYKLILKMSLIELIYFIILFIGVFTINNVFFLFILFLSFFETLIFKMTKNKIIRKISFIFDIFLSITILIIIIINTYFFQYDSVELINNLINNLWN